MLSEATHAVSHLFPVRVAYIFHQDLKLMMGTDRSVVFTSTSQGPSMGQRSGLSGGQTMCENDGTGA